MTAPAVIGAGIPSPVEIPIRAIPMVPIVPQEVPVASEVIEVIRSVAGRKIVGVRIFNPYDIIVGTTPDTIQTPIRIPMIAKITTDWSACVIPLIINPSMDRQSWPILSAMSAAMMTPINMGMCGSAP